MDLLYYGIHVLLILLVCEYYLLSVFSLAAYCKKVVVEIVVELLKEF